MLDVYRERFTEVRLHKIRLSVQDPPPRGSRVFHKTEAEPGDVLIPQPGKELLVWGKNKDRVVISYRHGESSGYSKHNIPGDLPLEQQAVVDRINTRGIFVHLKGEPKALKIACHGHHGTPLTNGWLLVGR